MSFPRYARYERNDALWPFEIPAHWTNQRLGHICQKIGSGKTPSGGSETYVSEGVLFIRSQNIHDSGLSLEDVVYINDAVDEEMRGSRVHDGDILLNITGASLGRTCIVPFGLPPSNVNQHVCIIRLSDVDHRDFTAWCMKSRAIQLQIELAQTGAAREGLNFAQIAQLQLPLPPAGERNAISVFLERETRRIDALIAEQQRLMELLQEKRQAVISHAVTKGLNPDALMKPSGVEWLGDVPSHWRVAKLKYIASVRTGVAKGKDNSGRRTVSVPYLRVANVQDGFLELGEIALMEVPTDDLERLLLRPGDVLMNEGGDFDKLGRGAIWHGQIDPCITQNHVFAVRPHAVSSDWLNAVTGSRYAQFYFMSRSKQSTNLASISSTNLMELPVVVPPEDEQREILTHVDIDATHCEELRVEAQKAIELLQERRIALITAAVTGQIDVRAVQVDDPSEAWREDFAHGASHLPSTALT